MATCGNCAALPNASRSSGKHARRRIVGRLRLIGIQGVVAERRLERLVVLGERPLGHGAAREETRHAFGIHDERTHAAGRILVDLEIRDVSAAPRAAIPARSACGSDRRACRLRSQDARLYSTRRLAGQDQAQLSVWPMPVGSELSRRAIRLPVGPQAPQKIQQPRCVLPSSRSSAKPASCSPALRVILVGSFGSARSLSALPDTPWRAPPGWAFGLRVFPGQVENRIGKSAAVLRVHARASG